VSIAQQVEVFHPHAPFDQKQFGNLVKPTIIYWAWI